MEINEVKQTLGIQRQYHSLMRVYVLVSLTRFETAKKWQSFFVTFCSWAEIIFKLRNLNGTTISVF